MFEATKNQDSNLLYELKLIFKKLSHRDRKLFLILTILLLISSGSELISLGAIVKYMDVLSNPEKILNDSNFDGVRNFISIDTNNELVLSVSLLLVFIIGTSNLLRIFTIKFQNSLSATISTRISTQVYNNTVQQPYNFHINRNTSELISSVMEDTRQLYSNIIMPLILLISNGFLMVAILLGLTVANWQLSSIGFCSIGIVYLVIYKFKNSVLRQNSTILVQSSQKQIKIVQESLGGIREVLIEKNQKFFQDKYSEADTEYRQASASNVFIGTTPRYIIETIAVILVVCLALFLNEDGDFSQTIPLLSAIVFASNRILPLLQQQFIAISKIQGARTSLTRIIWCLNLPLPNYYHPTRERLDFRKSLSFQNVWFRYKFSSKWILKDLCFEVKANTTVALVGSSGSGKSTIADLILGLLQPQEGAVLVDEQPLTERKVIQWQNTIAHVPQSIFLVDGTVAENIAFGLSKDKIDFERVVEAAKLAKIDEFVQQLPQKYNCKVGERGSRLSGGQRQRIGIARALYKRASVIIFDEATSSLDSETEREVMESINGLNNKITIILIAHRLSTIKNSDRIIEISNGRVVNQGTYDRLLQVSSSFKKMALG